MAKYIERLKEKVKIKKFDSNQPIGAWIFVAILNHNKLLKNLKKELIKYPINRLDNKN